MIMGDISMELVVDLLDMAMGCDGCRHISLFACGPDFRKNIVLNVSREQIDLPVTVSKLLGFSLPNSHGKVMTELFERR